MNLEYAHMDVYPCCSQCIENTVLKVGNYVDTSFSYFCPKYKRMCVYLAGNLMNCIFILTIYILCPQYLKYCYIIISNVLVNFIPIIKSDGYYTAMTFLNKYNADNDKKKEFVDDFIRGAIMFGIMSVLSYLF